jgi:NNMT/PNMT/TEMT family
LVADYSEWRARDYFDTYYSEVVLPDEQAVLAYQIDVLKAAGARFGRGLEYGCGPTLHRAIAASKYAFRIDMADWLADNLVEAREWLCADASAPEWKRFTRYVLACEGYARPSLDRVIQREALTRKVVRGLYVSDARLSQPLGPAREAFYDLIITGFCIDAISSDRSVWSRCMRNVTSMLEPGGTFIIHALHGCTAYKCGERMFPGSNLSIDDMRTAMVANGFVKSSIDVQVIPCPDNGVYGYSGILTGSGRKVPGRRRVH